MSGFGTANQQNTGDDLRACQRQDVGAHVTANGFSFWSYGPLGHVAGFMGCMRAKGYTFGDTPAFDLKPGLGQ